MGAEVARSVESREGARFSGTEVVGVRGAHCRRESPGIDAGIDVCSHL